MVLWFKEYRKLKGREFMRKKYRKTVRIQKFYEVFVDFKVQAVENQVPLLSYYEHIYWDQENTYHADGQTNRYREIYQHVALCRV